VNINSGYEESYFIAWCRRHNVERGLLPTPSYREREIEKGEVVSSKGRSGAATRCSTGSSRPPLFWGCVADMLLLGWLRGRDMDLPMVTPVSTCLFALDEARGFWARKIVRIPVCCGSCGGFAGRLLIERGRHLELHPVGRWHLPVTFVRLLRRKLPHGVHSNAHLWVVLLLRRRAGRTACSW
jgi:hypothetical protein